MLCRGVKLSVPSGDDLIDVHTGNIFNNLIPASKEITPKSTLLFIYSLQICHSSIFGGPELQYLGDNKFCSTLRIFLRDYQPFNECYCLIYIDQIGIFSTIILHFLEMS